LDVKILLATVGAVVAPERQNRRRETALAKRRPESALSDDAGVRGDAFYSAPPPADL
jgi:hypothetical protein